MARQFIAGIGQISNLGRNVEEARRVFQNPSLENLATLPLGHLESAEFPYEEKMFPVLSAELNPLKGALSLANRMALKAATEAVESSGLEPNDFSSLRVGVCVGSTGAATVSNHAFSVRHNGGAETDFSPFTLSTLNNPAQLIASHFGVTGPISTIDNACTSGTDAIGQGYEWLMRDKCDLVIVGGTDTVLENIYFGFRSLDLLAKTESRPFDKDRSGLVLGNAAGFLVLGKEGCLPEESWKAEVVGFGMGGDAHHSTTPHPHARGLSLAVNTALKDIKKESVSLINAHGTGTLNNDEIEGRYLIQNFPSAKVFGTKGYTGHTLGAAGALEAIWGVICFQDGVVPKTLGFENVDTEITLTPTSEKIPFDDEYFLSTSLGFGGVNSALLLRRGEA